MLFDHKFNERLLSFARNIAAITFLGGLAFLIMYRADTKVDLSICKYILLKGVGWIIFLTSMYLAFTNILVLYQDFREYLKDSLNKLQPNHSLNETQLKSTREITKKIIQVDTHKKIKLYFCYAFISLMIFIFIIIYVFGSTIAFLQLARIFGF